MRVFLACFLLLILIVPGIPPALVSGQGPIVVDRDAFPLNRVELRDWESSGERDPRNVRLPHYWKDAREGSFARDIIIPADMRGKAVFLQTVADTGGELFLDGAPRGSFEHTGRLLLTGRASGGERYRISLKSALAKPFGVFTDASLISLDAGLLPLYEKIRLLEKAISSLSIPGTAGWRFNPGDDPKFSAGEFDDTSWEPVAAPHYHRNGFSWAWYRSRIIIPGEINGRGVEGSTLSLRFVVNDHCEVFVDGHAAGYFRDQGFVTLSEKAKAGNAISVAVRVRNNYGKGGLVNAELVLKKHRDDLAGTKARLDEFVTLASGDKNSFPEKIAVAQALADAALSAAETSRVKYIPGSPLSVRKARARLDSFFAQHPLITKGPYLQNPRGSSMTVMWETNVPAVTDIAYGADTRSMRRLLLPGKRTIHRARLEGLAPGRKYYYRVRAGGTTGGTYSFITQPRIPSRFTFLVWGDTRSDPVAQEKVIEAMLGEKTAFAINVGDVVATGAREEWGPEHFSPIRKLARSMPTYIAIGNHEYFSMDDKGRVPWYERYTDQPGNGYWYSFDHGSGHFIVLDTNKAIPADIPPESEQYRWLVKDLESPASRKAAWRFVFMHHPLWTRGWSGEYYDGEPLLRERLRPLFEKHGVDIVFQGHTHDYEFGRLPKENGVAYVIAGGGGAPLDDTIFREWDHVERVEFKYHYCAIEVSGKKLRFRAVDTNGNAFDEREFVK